MSKLEEMGYELGDKPGQFKVAPYGVVYHFDKDYGYGSCSFGYEEICAIKEDMERLQSVKKMSNKYQEALNYFLDREEGDNMTVTIDWLDNAEMLQELIDRETPMKPIKGYAWYKCGRCEDYGIMDYSYMKQFDRCHKCGQTVAWGDNDE